MCLRNGMHADRESFGAVQLWIGFRFNNPLKARVLKPIVPAQVGLPYLHVSQASEGA
jgi:hypothetical protein